MDRHLRRISPGSWPGFHWLKGLLDEAVQSAQLRVGNDLMMFRRMLLMVEGVVADVANDVGPDLDSSLTASFLCRLGRESLVRAFRSARLALLRHAALECRPGASGFITSPSRPRKLPSIAGGRCSARAIEDRSRRDCREPTRPRRV